MLNKTTEKLKEIIRLKEPSLSEEKIDQLADQLIWLAQLAIKDYLKHTLSP